MDMPIADKDDSNFIIFLKLLIGIATAVMILFMTIGGAISVFKSKQKKMGFRQ
jgi:hypothetical protein